MDQSFDLLQLVADVDALALIELGSFEDPQIMTTVMAERHGMPCKVLFEDFAASLPLIIVSLRGLRRQKL